jgi:thiosulfate dehydrogenase [quinone] large subunit
MNAVALRPAAWLFVRLVLGVEWLRAGWEKLGDPGWTGDPTGAAVEGFLNGAIAKATGGAHPEVTGWYANLAEDVFLPNAELFAYFVPIGQLLVGAALIIGLLTRLSVGFGLSMNLLFLWAGVSATNPPMVLLGGALLLVGGGAGTYGVDRWALPWLRALAGQRILAAARGAVTVGGLVFAAWLAFITTDGATWVVAGFVVVAVVAGFHRAGAIRLEGSQTG